MSAPVLTFIMILCILALGAALIMFFSEYNND